MPRLNQSLLSSNLTFCLGLIWLLRGLAQKAEGTINMVVGSLWLRGEGPT
jgi:hypothetical protein